MAIQEVLSTGYDTAWVVVSFLVSACGAFAALSAATLVREGRRGVNWVNAGFAGLALGGVSIWSMHFIGMMAWETGVAVGYQLFGTLLSLVVAVLASVLLVLAIRLWSAWRFGTPIRYWWLSWLGALLIAAIVPASVWKTTTGRGWTWRGRQLEG